MKACKTCRVLMAPAGAVECPRCHRDSLELRELHQCSSEGCENLTTSSICDECQDRDCQENLYRSEFEAFDRYEKFLDTNFGSPEETDTQDDFEEGFDEDYFDPPDLYVPEIEGARIANHVRKEYRKTEGTLAGAIVVISVKKVPSRFKNDRESFEGTCLLDTGEVAAFSVPCGNWAYVDSPKKYFSVDLGWWELREIWEAAPPAPKVKEVFENDYQI